MGFLEDLVRTMQEASEEARQQQRSQRRSGPAWQAPSEARQANVVRRERKPTGEATPTGVPVLPPQSKAIGAVSPALASVAPATPSRFAALMRQRGSIRDALILSEILQAPLAQRRGYLKSPRRR
jgi:hypothetical protein